MKKNLTKNLIKDIKVSKALLNPTNFEPSLKIEFSISPEQIQDLVGIDIEQKDLYELIASPILEAIKNRS